MDASVTSARRIYLSLIDQVIPSEGGPDVSKRWDIFRAQIRVTQLYPLPGISFSNSSFVYSPIGMALSADGPRSGWLDLKQACEWAPMLR